MHLKRQVKIEQTIEIPKVPTFMKLTNGKAIALADLTADETYEIGKLWTKALLDQRLVQIENMTSLENANNK